MIVTNYLFCFMIYFSLMLIFDSNCKRLSIYWCFITLLHIEWKDTWHVIQRLFYYEGKEGCFCLQEVAQSAETTPNEAEVTSSNPSHPLMWTCQKKKKKVFFGGAFALWYSVDPMNVRHQLKCNLEIFFHGGTKRLEESEISVPQLYIMYYCLMWACCNIMDNFLLFYKLAKQ